MYVIFKICHIYQVFDGVKQSPIPAISRRSLRVEEGEEDEEEERRKEGAVEKMKRLLRVDSDETDDLHDKYRYNSS